MIETLRQTGLRDTFRDIHPDSDEVGTFHDFGRDFQPDKIDYVFVNSLVKTIDANIDRRLDTDGWVSDHYPIWAVVTY